MNKKKWVAILFVVCCVTVFSACGVQSALRKKAKTISTYTIAATLNDETKTVEATQNVHYKNETSVLLNEVCFHLYGRAFREGATIKPYAAYNKDKCFPHGESFGDVAIEKVCVQGKEVSFTIGGEDETILIVPLQEELYPESYVDIDISFTLTLSENTHRLGYYNGNINLGNWYPVACMYEQGDFLETAYYSTGDPFYTSVANYNVTFTMPSTYEVAYTGNVVSSSQNANMVTQTFKASVVRDFALTLSQQFEKVSGEVDGVTISYYGYKGDEDMKANLQTAVKAFTYYHKNFGEYPYEQLSVVKTPFMHGGMEYPNMVTIADSIVNDTDIVKVIAHEIAHQWWYGVVGNNQLDEAWLDEAMAEYSTIMFLEAHSEYGVTHADSMAEYISSYILFVDVADSITGKVNTNMELSLKEYTTDYEYTYMVYVRGAIMLDTLRTTIGQKQFLKGIQTYYKQNTFAIAQKGNFIAAFEKASGMQLESFFTSWLSGSAVVAG